MAKIIDFKSFMQLPPDVLRQPFFNQFEADDRQNLLGILEDYWLEYPGCRFSFWEPKIFQNHVQSIPDGGLISKDSIKLTPTTWISLHISNTEGHVNINITTIPATPGNVVYLGDYRTEF